jgi:hypothetical protein
MATSDRITMIARQWAAAQPALKSRIERAVGLTQSVTTASPSSFIVRSPGGEYLVSINMQTKKSSCTCEDARKGGTSHCKHQIAVGLVLAANQS